MDDGGDVYIYREGASRERDRARGKICTLRVEGSNVLDSRGRLAG